MKNTILVLIAFMLMAVVGVKAQKSEKVKHGIPVLVLTTDPPQYQDKNSVVWQEEEPAIIRDSTSYISNVGISSEPSIKIVIDTLLKEHLNYIPEYYSCRIMGSSFIIKSTEPPKIGCIKVSDGAGNVKIRDNE